MNVGHRILGNGNETFAKGASKFEGVFKHPGNKGLPTSRGIKGKRIGGSK